LLIGLVVGLQDYTLGLEADKVEKILLFLGSLKVGDRQDRRGLLKGVGVLIWASAILPWLKPTLAEFYNLANRPGLIWQKLSLELLTAVFQALDAEGRLRWQVPGVVFRAGLVLGFVGKHKVKKR
jgi:hypothetical protein